MFLRVIFLSSRYVCVFFTGVNVNYKEGRFGFSFVVVGRGFVRRWFEVGFG